MNHRINHANIKEWAKNYDGPQFDGILCDPPYELGFMGKSWDSSGIAFDQDMWADLLRILKPGGHLLAFSSSRTYHRMAVAIEDAGFEIRDMIEWVYGSGFPKSLNISKALDKQAGEQRNRVKVPEAARDSVDYGKYSGEIDDNNPITEEATYWNGYGTALKPAHEPCVLARKPMIDPDIDLTETVRRAIIDTGLTEDIQWNYVSVADAEKSRQLTYLSTTHLLRTAETYARRVKSKQTTDTENDTESHYAKEQKNDTKKDQTTTSSTEKSLPSDLKTKSSTPTVTSASVVENQSEHSSRLTTLTVAVDSTEKVTTAKYIQNLGDKGFLLDTELFAGTVTGLTDLATPVLIARNSDGTYTYPKELPKIIKGGSNTVANNALKYGTGGLNIDGTRVAHNVEPVYTNRTAPKSSGEKMGTFKENGNMATPNPTGRFPANLIHDGSDEVEAVFPSSKGNGSKGGGSGGIWTTGNKQQVSPGYIDSGSASRFFYTAKSSKSERNLGLEEFEEVLGGSLEGGNDKRKGDRPQLQPTKNHHPTVKPLALTKYLATLIKPPTGGRLLVPFSGSGSEMIGALQAGWDYVEGVELTEEYIPIAEARIKYWLELKAKEKPQLELI